MVRRNSIRVAILSGLAVFVPQALSQSTRPADPQGKHGRTMIRASGLEKNHSA